MYPRSPGDIMPADVTTIVGRSDGTCWAPGTYNNLWSNRYYAYVFLSTCLLCSACIYQGCSRNSNRAICVNITPDEPIDKYTFSEHCAKHYSHYYKPNDVCKFAIRIRRNATVNRRVAVLIANDPIYQSWRSDQSDRCRTRGCIASDQYV